VPLTPLLFFRIITCPSPRRPRFSVAKRLHTTCKHALVAQNASRSEGRSDDGIMNFEAPGTCACPAISPFSILTSSSVTKALSRPLTLAAFPFAYTPMESPRLRRQDLMQRATITPAESAHITVLDEGDDNSLDKALTTGLAARARHLAHASSLRTPAASRLRVRTSINRCRAATTTTPPSITALAATAAFPRDSRTDEYVPTTVSRTPARPRLLASELGHAKSRRLSYQLKSGKQPRTTGCSNSQKPI
jgi:hypothetical protein